MRFYRVKQWLAAGLTAVLLSGCSGTPGMQGGNKAGETEKIGLYDRGLKLMAKMDLMAESDVYTEMMISSPEVTNILEEIGEQDYHEPKVVYEVKLSGDILKNLQNMYGGEMDSMLDLPEELQEDLKHRIIESVPSMLSAMEGSNALAAMSLITADDYFIDETVTEDTIYLYLYDGRYCGAVVYSPHDEGIVSASGRMIVSEMLGQAADKEEIKNWIVQNAGLLGAEISEVFP